MLETVSGAKMFKKGMSVSYRYSRSKDRYSSGTVPEKPFPAIFSSLSEVHPSISGGLVRRLSETSREVNCTSPSKAALALNASRFALKSLYEICVQMERVRLKCHFS